MLIGSAVMEGFRRRQSVEPLFSLFSPHGPVGLTPDHQQETPQRSFPCLFRNPEGTAQDGTPLIIFMFLLCLPRALLLTSPPPPPPPQPFLRCIESC